MSVIWYRIDFELIFVISAERGEDSLFMKDEFIEYTIKISKGSLSANPYQTT